MPPVKKTQQKDARPVKDEVEATPVISGQLQRKISKQKRIAEEKRGIVFIKHLPHGFFEDQLKKYFQQFGNVTQLRLARSKRTGGSKGYAFVEFEYPEVAQVAAETMDNYLMFHKVVKASYIPPDMQRFNYFKTSLRKVKNKAGKDIYISGKSAAIQRKVKQRNDWSDSAYQKRTAKQLKKLEKFQEKYAHLGIDFSSIVVQPKLVDAVAKIEEENKLNSTEKKEENSSSAKNKRKNVLEPASSSKLQKKTKEDIKLEDLLGNTIGEDSEDEDYVAWDDLVDEPASSDEESYRLLKGSDADGNEKEEEEDSDDHEELSPIKSNKKSSLQKPTKPSKVDRFDQLIKRKPHFGGVQKLGKKPANKAIISKAKKSMQVAVVKELVKTKTNAAPKIKAKSARKQKR